MTNILKFGKLIFIMLASILFVFLGCRKVSISQVELSKQLVDKMASSTVLTSDILIPTESDAYINNGKYANTNYGSFSYLVAKDDLTDYKRDIVLKFDLSSISSTEIENARIELVGGVSKETEVENAKWQYFLINNDWSESNITWNNAPQEGTLLGEVNGVLKGTNTVVEFFLPSEVIRNAYNSTGRKLSIRVVAKKKNATGISFYSDFASKEAVDALTRPRLKFKYVDGYAAGYYTNLIMDKITYDSIQFDLKNSNQAVQLINTQLTAKANSALVDSTLDIRNVNSIEDASVVGKAIYQLSLQYFLFQNNPNANQYLERSKELLLKWAALNKPTDHTPNESAFLNFIYGYSLIKKRIDADSKSKIDIWLSNRFIYYRGLSVRSNNWETIRNALMLNIGYVLARQDYIDKALSDFNTHHNKNYRADGASVDFLGRDGFAYHTYDMNFCAQIARTLYINKGRDEVNKFANHRSTQWVNLRINANDTPVLGGSFADGVYFMKPYVMDPANNVHLEFVNTEWAPDKNRGDYNKPYNPGGSRYVFVEVAAIMKDDMLSFIQKSAPTFNRYSDLTFYLNSFGPKYSVPEVQYVTVYGDIPFKGWHKQIGVGSYSRQDLQELGVLNNAVSSISIPEGYKATLYDNDNLSGSSIVLTKHTIDLVKLNFNDKMSSIKIEKINM